VSTPGRREATRTLRLEPLTEEAFAPFGSVLDGAPDLAPTPTEGDARTLRPARRVNGGTALRFDELAPVTSARPAARLNMCLFACDEFEGTSLPVPLLEMHPFSSQIFMPLTPARYVVVVAPGSGALNAGASAAGAQASARASRPMLAQARAFLASGPMGIAYNMGTWHAPLRVLGEAARFLCLVHEDGSADDCIELALGENAFEVAVPQGSVGPTTPRKSAIRALF
jgi:ureidoglycolate lyase